MLNRVLNTKYLPWLVAAVLMLCAVISYILTLYEIYTSLATRVNHFDSFYSQRLESANRSLRAVEQELHGLSVDSCSQTVVDALKGQLLTSDNQAIFWVKFTGEQLVCSALGVSQLPQPQYYSVVGSMKNGLHIYQEVASRNLNAKKPIYVGRHTEPYKVFIAIDLLPYIEDTVDNCLDCSVFSIELDNQYELFRIKSSDPYWGALEYRSETTGLIYRFSLSLYTKALLWFRYFVAVIAFFCMLFVGWQLLRGGVRQYCWHRLFTTALNKSEFSLAYQPVVDTENLNCFGVEALLRWSRRDGTTRSTCDFIEQLERDPVMPEVTRWVVKTALIELRELLDANVIHWCSINVSAMEIEQGQMQRLLNELVEQGYPVAYLSFELTERVPISNWQHVEQFIQLCQELGCKVKLDDVGTGYGGNLCLQNLDFDYLKIDKQFVSHLGTAVSKLSLIGSYIAIAKELNIKVIAEGVETQEQAEILKTIGVILHQGWLYSKALPIKELSAYLH